MSQNQNWHFKVLPIHQGISRRMWHHLGFPGYVDMTDGGAASKVTRILAKCKAGGVKGIPANASSHGIRVSAINTMMFHEGLTLSSVIARGGWDHDQESMINCYFT